MSSFSDPSPRFSLIAFPLKVRDSVFRRVTKSAMKPQDKRNKKRSSTTDTTRTVSSTASTPRDSVLYVKQQEEYEKNVEKFRLFWNEKLRSTMERLATGRLKCQEAENSVFHLLLKLYAHQDVVDELYRSYDLNADEFVFYIPQLCTFFMHGNYAKQQELECFLMSRSGESLSFAHRLTWFLRSFCGNAKKHQFEHFSVTAAASERQENPDFLDAIGKRAGVPALLMNSGLCVEEVMATNPDNLKRRRCTAFPTDDELQFTTYESDESFAGHLLQRRNSVQDEARTDEGNSQQFLLFNQTPKFVEALTDLAEQLIPTPLSQRNNELRKGLSEIDKQMLPSDVIYLPIGNPYHRIKRIRAEECFTFSTKQRVPYFLCVEVLDYSVTPPSAVSKKQVKKKTSKASRNQTRVFSLKLPFKKADADLVAAVHDTPMSSSTSPESDLSSVSSPSASSALSETADERCPTSSPSSASLQDVDDEVVLIGNRMDSEDGDDEKEEGEHQKSFREGDDFRRAEEDQQKRLGQWNLPRSQRRKECSYSALACSGGQFESFYSSWASNKAHQSTDEDGHVPPVFEPTKGSDAAEKGVAVRLMKHEEPAIITEVVAGVGDGKVETCDLHEELSAQSTSLVSDSVAVSTTEGSLLIPLFEKVTLEDTAQDSVASISQPNAQPSTNEKGAWNGVEPVKSNASKGMGAERIFLFSLAAQAPGPFSTLLLNNSMDNLRPSSLEEMLALVKKEIKQGATTTATNDGEGNAAVTITPVCSSASIVAKKSKVAVVSSDSTSEPAWSLHSGEEGLLNEIDAAGVDEEESEPMEALPSDTDFIDRASASLIEMSEGGATDDAIAEDADGEDTDSNDGCVWDDEEASREPEPLPAKKSTLKPFSFVMWFYRKSVTGFAGQKPAKRLEGAPALIESATALSETVNPAVDTSELSASVVKGTNVRKSETHFQQRRRDLSISIDFADPTAWKEKFDLGDGLTEEDPDVDAVDTGSVDDDNEVEDAPLNEEEDEKPMIVFRERWSEKEARIRSESPYGDHPGWRLLPVIVKSNDDLRQEQFAAQLIAQCDRIFREYSLPLLLRPYNVIATSAKTGLIEAVPDTVSLDSLKRNDPSYTTLLDFYVRLHGNKGTAGFARAQKNFVESLAAYSMVCYVFQIKDRHNGNILVDTDGHVIHIDFGFLLTNSPGSNWNFERAPFKLTDEFVELMGGARSSTFRYFRSLCIRAFLALRRNMDQIVLLVEMMLVENADLPCFAGGKRTVIEGLRARLKSGAPTSTCQVFVNQLVDQSINNWRTRWYDKYQRACLGIL
ncbi:unnamed protein product [Peronospora belbahrii]|nr:unnamed protein product [Peronospora belbahrii]